MSLPSSEPLPNDINELPPTRQRHIRRQPRKASAAERRVLLDSLMQLTAPRFSFFTRGLLGSLAVGTALYFEEPVILIASILIFPFLSPIFRIALLPVHHKMRDGLTGLISLFILFLLTFISGSAAGWLHKTSSFSLLLERFSKPYWLDLLIVILCSVLCVIVLIRRGTLPNLISTLLTFEILVPIAAAGFGFPLRIAHLFPFALLVSVMHLSLAVAAAMITFLWMGFPPRRWIGRLLFAIPFILIVGTYALSTHFTTLRENPTTQPGITLQPTRAPSQTPPVNVTPSSTPFQTRASSTLFSTSTSSPSPPASPTPTLTPTPKPTTFSIYVKATEGVVIRESPDFSALITSYANFGDSLEIINQTQSSEGTRWYQVRNSTGETGWLLASLTITQTPQTIED